MGSRAQWMRWIEGPAWRPAVLLALTVVGCYAQGLGNGFLWIDHSEIVDGTMRIREWRELPDLFLRANNAAGYHRPVYPLLLTLDHGLWGDRALGYYLSSMLLHAANVVLLLLLLRRCGTGAGTAVAIAALWGLHPVHTAVAGLIHAKADLFGLLCSLVCLLACERLRRPPRPSPLVFAVGLVAFALGALTKELVFLLPLLVAVVAWRRRIPTLRPFVIALAGVALALGILHVAATAEVATRPAELGLGERLLTFTTVYLDYLRLLTLPWTLTMSDTVTRFGALSPSSQSAALGTFALVALGMGYAAWRWATLGGWILLFHLCLVPVAQVVPILHFRADRYLYLPSLAFVGGVVEATALAVVSWQNRSAPQRVARILGAVAALVCILFAARITLRLREFRDDITLFSVEVARTPDYREGLTHLGRAYDRRGEPAAAASCYRMAWLPNPDRVSYVNREALLVNYTKALVAAGQPEKAFELASANAVSVQSASHRLELSYNRAVAAFDLGRFPIAVELLSSYLQQRPADGVGWFLLGTAAVEAGDKDTARRALRRYLDLGLPDPQRQAWAERILRSL